MSYVMEHDHKILSDGSYNYELKGQAPSAEQLSDKLTTDEFLIQYYMNYIRYSNLGMDLESMWDDQSALIYNTLANAVAECNSEDYELNAKVLYRREDYSSGDIEPLIINNDLINTPPKAIFTIEHGVPMEQVLRCNRDAIRMLHDNGEINDQMYETLISQVTPENYGFTADDKVSPSGHPNQAVGTVEQVPEWCEDGSIIYGYSNPDSNGYWMHYSKFPKVFDTAGYFIDNSGVRITCYFAQPFPQGTKLYIDWWADDVKVVDNECVTVGQGGSNMVETYLRTKGMPGAKKYEMRIWETEEHSRVLAYVSIYH